MKYYKISNFSFSILDRMLDLVGKKCNKIFLTELSTINEKILLTELKEYILDSKRVTIWDGTEIAAGENRIEGVIPEEELPLQHLIECNEATIELIKKYNNLQKRGIFTRSSHFDIAFYHDDDCYFFTTAHEDSICIKEDFYRELKDSTK